MRIERHAPLVRRGVTQLMYVGDDDAVETAVSTGKRGAQLIGAGIAAMVLCRGTLRIAGGIAAAIGALMITD